MGPWRRRVAEEEGLRGALEDLRAVEWGQVRVGRSFCREGWGDLGTLVGAEDPCSPEFSCGGRVCGGGGGGETWRGELPGRRITGSALPGFEGAS